MRFEEAERRFLESQQQFKDALREREEIQNHIRCQGAKTARRLRKAEKTEVQEAAKTYEALGLPPAAAKAAARGREERF